MRTIIVIASLLLTGCNPDVAHIHCQRQRASLRPENAGLCPDRTMHHLPCGYSRDRSAAIGLMFSVSLGASKELWDSRPAGSGWSWKDFAWDVAGATTGYAVWQLAHQ